MYPQVDINIHETKRIEFEVERLTADENGELRPVEDVEAETGEIVPEDEIEKSGKTRYSISSKPADYDWSGITFVYEAYAWTDLDEEYLFNNTGPDHKYSPTVWIGFKGGRADWDNKKTTAEGGGYKTPIVYSGGKNAESLVGLHNGLIDDEVNEIYLTYVEWGEGDKDYWIPDETEATFEIVIKATKMEIEESTVSITTKDQHGDPIPGVAHVYADDGTYKSAAYNSQGVAEMTFSPYEILQFSPTEHFGSAETSITIESIAAELDYGYFLSSGTKQDSNEIRLNAALGFGEHREYTMNATTVSYTEEITTSEELENIKYYIGYDDTKDYKIMNDLNMIGCDGKPTYNEFNGLIDGQNNTIIGLEQDIIGDLGENGKITKLNVRNNFGGKIVDTNKGLISYCSNEDNPIAGITDDGGVIELCYTTGIIEAEVVLKYSNLDTLSKVYCGGITHQLNGTIRSCYSDAEIRSTDLSEYSVDRSTTKGLGGLVGLIYLGDIINSFSRSDIINQYLESEVGGLVGHTSSATIDYSYFAGTISSPSKATIGGLVGTIDKGVITESYYDKNIIGIIPDSGISNGRTTDEMTAPHNPEEIYQSWNLGQDWRIEEGLNDGYPAILYFTIKYIEKISNAKELLEAKYYLKYYGPSNYKLMNNIDVSEVRIYNSVHGLIENFNGVFDGQGYSIKNISVPLFGGLGSDSNIKNLGLENVNIDSESRTIGALGVTNGGVVDNCYVSGEIIGTQTVGALVGMNEGTITKSYAKSNIKGQGFISGFCGMNYGTLKNCYSRGNINQGDEVSGLAVINYGNIEKCYSAMKIVEIQQAEGGGFVSYNSGTIDNSYYDKDKVMDGLNNGVGEARTTEQMTIPYDEDATYQNWVFDSIWYIAGNANDGYPQLEEIVAAVKILLNKYRKLDEEYGFGLDLEAELKDMGTYEELECFFQYATDKDFVLFAEETEMQPSKTPTTFGTKVPEEYYFAPTPRLTVLSDNRTYYVRAGAKPPGKSLIDIGENEVFWSEKIKIAPPNITRNEKFVSSPNRDLYQRGKEILIKNNQEISFDLEYKPESTENVEVTINNNAQYLQDFRVGDMITIYLPNIVSIKTRIIEVQEETTKDENNLKLTLGKKWPDIIEKISSRSNSLDPEARK